MKKSELETKLLELEKKIISLEARPQFCMGHNCCNHVCTLPHYPNYPYQQFWTATSGITSEPVKFGNIS